MSLSKIQAAFLSKHLGIEIDVSLIGEDSDEPDYAKNAAGRLMARIDAMGGELSDLVGDFETEVAKNAAVFQRAGGTHAHVHERLMNQSTHLGELTLRDWMERRKSAQGMANEIEGTANQGHVEAMERGIADVATFLESDFKSFEGALDKLRADHTEALKAANEAIAVFRAAQSRDGGPFQVLASQLDDSLVNLMNWAAPEARSLYAALGKIKGDAYKDFTKALAQAKELEPKVAAAEKAEKERFAGAKQAFDKRLNALDVDLKTLKSASTPQAIRDEISEQIAQARLIAGAGSSSKALTAAGTFCAVAEQLVAKGKSEGNTLKEITALQKEIATVLGEKDYQTARPNDHTSIKARADSEAKSWFSKTVAQAKTDYQALRDLVVTDNTQDAFKGRCETQKAWKEDFDDKVAVLKKDIAKLDALVKKLGLGNKYQGALHEQLKFLSSASSGEKSYDQMRNLTNQLAKNRDQVFNYLRIEDTAADAQKLSKLKVDQDEGKLKADEFDAALKDFLKEHTGFLKNYKAVKKPSRSADEAEYDSIGKQSESARKVAEASRDVETANRLLARCRERLNALQDPESQIDRSKLGEISRRLDAGIADFRTKADDLRVKVGGAVAGTGFQNSTDALNHAIDDVMLLLNSINLDSQAEILSDPEKSTQPQRLRAREKVIRQVQRASTFLVKSPAFKHLVGNPFKANAVGTKLLKSLRDIELDVLRGV